MRFKQGGNLCKRILEGDEFAYNKTKESITSQKLGPHDFRQIANSVPNKSKSAIHPEFNGPEVLPVASYKTKLFPENFSKNPNFDDSGIYYYYYYYYYYCNFHPPVTT